MACKRCGRATSVAEAHGDGPTCECDNPIPDGKMFSTYEVYGSQDGIATSRLTLVGVATFIFYRRILFIVGCDDNVNEEAVVHMPPSEGNVLSSLRQEDVIDFLNQRFNAEAIYQDGKQVV